MTTPQHHRGSIRLRHYDYASSGAYFVTICTAQKLHVFGEILEGAMVLNEFGKVVLEEWNQTAEQRQNVELDAFVVMPNHIHGILWITQSDVGAQRAAPLHGAPPQLNVAPGSLGAIVRSFKSAVTKRINEARGTPSIPVWQRNYHEHIIRNHADLERVRVYTTNNPLEWMLDEYAVAA